MNTGIKLCFVLLVWALFGCEDNPPFYEAKSSFELSTNKVYIDTRVMFINSSDSVNVEYDWDFGDGVTSKKRNPLHGFKNSGYYDVKLCVSVNGIKTDSTIKNVKVIIGETHFDYYEQTRAYDFAQCMDSSFLVIGDARSRDEYTMFISKFDKNLKNKWVKKLNSDRNYPFGNIKRLSDGNFIVSGSFDNADDEGHFALTKIDDKGRRIWHKRYPQTNGHCRFATEAEEGGIISIGSETHILPNTGNRVEIVTVLKTDANGNFEWKKQFLDDWLLDARNILTLDDGYVFASSTVNEGPYINSHDSLVLAKVDFNGELIWKKTKEWQIPDSHVAYRVWESTVTKNSSNFVVVNEGNKLVMVFDLQGNFIKRNYTKIVSNRTIATTVNNKFVVAGGEYSWHELAINGFDERVENRWEKDLGSRKGMWGLFDGYGATVKSLFDGNLLLVGKLDKDKGNKDVYSMLLVKINEEGEIQ